MERVRTRKSVKRAKALRAKTLKAKTLKAKTLYAWRNFIYNKKYSEKGFCLV